MDTRLILVDGCPGSGKSSTSQFLWRQLQQAGHTCRWYHEEERPHPVAPNKGISNSKGFREYGRSTLVGWRDFARRARRSKEVSIIESHFFQDTVGPLLHANVKSTRTVELVQGIAESCAPLQPVLLYLHQPDYAATMRRMLDERGSRVEELYIRDSTASAYAKRRGLEGFDGLVQGWVAARAIMEQLLEGLDLPTLSIDNTAGDWDSYNRQIGDFLTITLEAAPAVSKEELMAYAGTYTFQQDAAPRRTGGETRFARVDVSRRVGGVPRLAPQYHHKDTEFTIALENGHLVMRDYGWLWPTNHLIPLRQDVFDIRSWPFQLHFERDSSGDIIGASRKSETTRWQVTGQGYPRVVEKPEKE